MRFRYTTFSELSISVTEADLLAACNEIKETKREKDRSDMIMAMYSSSAADLRPNRVDTAPKPKFKPGPVAEPEIKVIPLPLRIPRPKVGLISSS